MEPKTWRRRSIPFSITVYTVVDVIDNHISVSTRSSNRKKPDSAHIRRMARLGLSEADMLSIGVMLARYIGVEMSQFLFLSYYRLDPWLFEPAIEKVHNCSIIDSNRRIRFHLLDRWQQNAENERELLGVGVYERSVEGTTHDVLSNNYKIPLDDLLKKRHLEAYPEEYRLLLTEIHETLDRFSTESLDLLCWRYRLGGGPPNLRSELSFIRYKSGSWNESIDPFGPGWRQVPSGIQSLGLPSTIEIDLPDSDGEDLSKRLMRNEPEPVGHNLFREAWRIRKSNPRSAIVMAVAAAETGFKDFAAELLPATAWLLKEMPSPPLDRMIRSWMEQIPAKGPIEGQIRRPPNQCIVRLKRAIEVRNGLVHGRNFDLGGEELEVVFMAIRDLLYLLDFYKGEKWAIDFVTDECRAAILAPQ